MVRIFRILRIGIGGIDRIFRNVIMLAKQSFYFEAGGAKIHSSFLNYLYHTTFFHLNRLNQDGQNFRDLPGYPSDPVNPLIPTILIQTFFYILAIL